MSTAGPHGDGPGRGRGSLLARAVLVGLLLSAAPATPALAHAAHSPAATNHRTEVDGVTPALPGVRVRAVEAGTALELTNSGPRPVEVLGHLGEPFLRIGPDGVFENTLSPTTYQSREPGGVAPVPAHVDATAAPQWQRVGAEPVARWYDRRVTMPDGRTPEARSWRWSVPLRQDGVAAEITGSVRWLAPPSPWPWWAGVTLAAAAVAALGARIGRPAARAALGLAAVTAGLVAVGYGVAREVDAGARHPGEVVVWILTGDLWPALAGLATAAVGGYLVGGAVRDVRRRPPAAPVAGGPGEGPVFALAVTGACLTLFAGVANAAVITRSVAPVPGDITEARAAVAVVLATGIGLTAAALVGLRRLRPAVQPPATGAAPTEPERPAADRSTENP